jgi:putative transposase
VTEHKLFNPEIYTRRSSNRLPFYDYRSSGAYFITVCTEDRQHVFEIDSLRAALLATWQSLPQLFPGLKLGEFVVMPDHVHGILWLDRSVKDPPSLGQVVGAFKSLMTRAWRSYHQEMGKDCVKHLWQRNYYEHVVRSDDDLHLIREYIVNNPLKALLLQQQWREEAALAKKRALRP